MRVEGVKRLAPKTDWDRLNELIDWYEKNNPKAGQVIQVRFDADYLDKRCKRVRQSKPTAPDQWEHRGRILERVKGERER